MAAITLLCRHCGAPLELCHDYDYEHSSGWLSCNHHAKEHGLPAVYNMKVASPLKEEDIVSRILIKYTNEVASS